MPDTYYYSGRSGDRFVDAQLHHRSDCDTLQSADGGVRPINAGSVDRNNADLCSDCTPLGNDSDSDTDSGGEICGTEKADGDRCERPAGECPYHGED